MANPGKKYERLPQAVFQAILEQDDARNVQVQHDVVVQGITLQHQIDVYWEFEIGGITYRTVVQCKDWQSPVKQGQVLEFSSVLNDLPGQPRGIIVSQGGFQKGAKRFAQEHGIELYELRAPKDQDWAAAFLRSVRIKGELLVPKVHDVLFVLDANWLSAETQRLGLDPNMTPNPVNGVAGQIRIEREDGTTLTTAGDVLERLIPKERGPADWSEYEFQEIAYVATSTAGLPRVRLRALKARIELVVGMTREISIRFDEFVHFVLKKVRDGSWLPLDSAGRPLQVGNGRPPRLIDANSANETEKPADRK